MDICLFQVEGQAERLSYVPEVRKTLFKTALTFLITLSATHLIGLIVLGDQINM